MWQYSRDPLKYEYGAGTIDYMNKQFAHVWEQHKSPEDDGDDDARARYEFYHDMIFMMGEMVLAHGTPQNREWLAQEAGDCCMLWNADTRKWYNEDWPEDGDASDAEDGPN